MGDAVYKSFIDDMTWSYSRVKSFEDCPYRWKLKYIHKLKPKEMFFSQYGSFVHSILERYYKGELGINQLLTEYLINFNKMVSCNAPNEKIFKSYLDSGIKYMKEFSPFNVEKISVEEKIDTDINGTPFTCRIDFLGKNGDDIYLIDHKSRKLKKRSNRKKQTVMDKELDDYLIQQYLYAKPIMDKYGKLPSYLGFNCFRNEDKDRLIIEEFDEEKYKKAQEWLINNVKKISEESNFKPNMDMFKCKHLCEMQDYCEYYQMTWGD